MKSVFAFALFTTAVVADTAEEHPGQELLEVKLESQEQLDLILGMLKTSPPVFDRDEDFEILAPDDVLVWASKEQRNALEQSGFSPVPGVDPSASFDVVQMTNYTYSSGTQDWSQYCGYDCMTARLQDISAECGYTLESVGQSVQGREIWVMTVGPSSEPKVLMASNIHGDEVVGGQLSQRFLWESCFEPTAEQANIATSMTTAWMPMMNPDGYESNRRNNANNRDLNRDFPIPGQTPNRNRQVETLAYMDYVAAHPSLRTSIMYHGGAVVANYPYDSCSYNISPSPCGSNGRPPALTPEDAWAVEMAEAYTWPVGTRCLYNNCIINGADWYQITGSLQDYNYYFHNVMDITLEVSQIKRPNSSTLPSFWTENYNAMVNYIDVSQKF